MSFIKLRPFFLFIFYYSQKSMTTEKNAVQLKTSSERERASKLFNYFLLIDAFIFHDILISIRNQRKRRKRTQERGVCCRGNKNNQFARCPSILFYRGIHLPIV